ncbi:MOSC domain-containing protein [Deinococcus apachensis]|uniref:MOSC domain-containing protein n=1 Tax=Deinococcus apachensis TaxID=309886 RepID=UPI00035D5E65|nr:MOSC N-terminal beta barrel domain-containing protein [Deinococcus apachensis]
MSTPLTLSGLYTYPIKSARGVALDRARVELFGLGLDRRWMVVDGGGRQVTGRDFPRMDLVGVGLEPGGLRVTAPGMPPLPVPHGPGGPGRLVHIFRQPVQAVEVGGEANAWWSAYLGLPAALVYFPDEAERHMNPRFGTARISFADGNPLHLVSEASVADLNTRLPHPVTPERFRPNLVVRGGAAYGEDGWGRIRIGDLEFGVVEPCARCSVLNISEGRMGGEPLRTLAGYRRRGRLVEFGQNLVHAEQGELKLGDPIVVLRRGSR